jgi:hypothetical protein
VSDGAGGGAANREYLTMKRHACIALMTLGLGAASLPAAALTLEHWSLSGPGTFTDHSAPGLLAFDFDPASLHTGLSVTYLLGHDDVSAPLSFNAVVRNLTQAPAGIEVLRLDIGGTNFGVVGSVSRAFGGDTTITLEGATATLQLQPAEFFEIEIGDAFGTTAGASNWTLAVAGLSAGDRITITAAVPEPETWAMLAAGLALLGAATRKTRGRKR